MARSDPNSIAFTAGVASSTHSGQLCKRSKMEIELPFRFFQLLKISAGKDAADQGWIFKPSPALIVRPTKEVSWQGDSRIGVFISHSA